MDFASLKCYLLNMFKTKTAGGRRRKSDATRQRLVDVSMKLFLEQGFERTTMREIARAADLSLGAAYYYFPSKESLIFDFYEQSYEAHLPRVGEVLAERKRLADRLAGVIAAHIDVAQPYHGVSKALFRTAADPEHEISPFSEASGPLRDKNIAVMQDVVAGSHARVSGRFGKALPELLWLFKMGVLLYWIHDKSPERKNTYRLIKEGSDLASRLVSVANLPVIRSVTLRALDLFDELKPYGQ